MVELNPQVVNAIRRQIENKIAIHQAQERQVEFQNEVKKVEQEIWARKAFHRNLPQRLTVTDDKAPINDRRAFAPSRVFSLPLNRDSDSYMGMSDYFGALVFGKSQSTKRKK